MGFMFSLFVIGMIRGSTICMIACAPGIIPYLVSKGYDRKKCLRLAIIFNLPRIFVLTVFGVIIGILAFIIANEVFKDVVIPYLAKVQVVGYGILGVFIFIYGAHMFVNSVERREDMKDNKQPQKSCEKNCKKTKSDAISENCSMETEKKKKVSKKIQESLQNLQKKPNTLFFVWGGILSIACLGEILLIEASMVSGTLGFVSNTVHIAALLGGLGMFLFAVGAAMPIIIVAVLSSSIKDYFNNVEKLESIKTVGSIIMIMMGLIFIVTLISKFPLILA